MVAISGRWTAEKLSEFSLTVSRHIVAVVTDGASAMANLGRCVDCEHQPSTSTEDQRSGINIEDGQNEEQTTSGAICFQMR